MGGHYRQPPPPDYWAQQAASNQMNLIYHTNDQAPAPNPYPGMSVMPEGRTLERIEGRFYISKCRLTWAYEVYELCDDLVYRTYGTVYGVAKARQTAQAMHRLTQRANAIIADLRIKLDVARAP